MDKTLIQVGIKFRDFLISKKLVPGETYEEVIMRLVNYKEEKKK